MKILDNLILIPWILGFLNLSAPFSNFYFFWIVTVTFYGLLFVHLIECIVYKEKIMNCDNIILFCCGNSFHACLYSIYHFKRLCDFKNVVAIDACNFEEYLIPKGNNCYFYVSQSGETKDLYSVFKIISENKYLNGINVGIINVVDSLIARSVDCGVYLNIGKEMGVASTKVFLAQSLVLILIATFLNCNGSNYSNNLVNNLLNFLCSLIPCFLK